MLRIHTDTATQRITALPPSTGSARRTGPAPSGDTLDLSPTARLFMSARQTLSALPAVRSDRVTDLQQLVSSGRYEVNGETCAAAMLASGEVEGSA